MKEFFRTNFKARDNCTFFSCNSNSVAGAAFMSASVFIVRIINILGIIINKINIKAAEDSFSYMLSYGVC